MFLLKDCLFFLFCATATQWARASSFTRFLDHTQRHSAVGRTPLDEWSARRRDLYLKTHNTHNRRDIHASCGIRTRNLSRDRTQTYAFERAGTGTGLRNCLPTYNAVVCVTEWQSVSHPDFYGCRLSYSQWGARCGRKVAELWLKKQFSIEHVKQYSTNRYTLNITMDEMNDVCVQQ